MISDAHQKVAAAIAAFARGEIVIVTDDDDRENEGDLFVAASLCTTEKMAFIIRNTSGIVCVPVGPEDARRLHLDPMVALNDAPLGTAFTVSVDVRHGLTTGISAEERTNTVRAIANGNSGAADFVRPGHVFPLVAKAGGVLMRSGHTEACIDLCKLAGLPPVGVLAELMNDDGTVMRGPEIAAFAERHKLQRISIAELIAHRQTRDKLIERVGEFPVESEIGTLTGYAFLTPFDPVYHMAFVHGEIGDGRNVLARLHRANIITDVFGGAKPIHSVLRRFKSEGRGMLIFLRDGTAGVPVDFDTEIGRYRLRRGAHAAMARDRARRADSQGPRRHLDPAADIVAPHDLCRPVRLRHRDRRHRAGLRLNRRRSGRVILLVKKEGDMTPIASRIRAVLAVVGIGLALSGCGYNTIPTLEEQAKARWADVQNQYQRRADLIPNLVATVQGYAKQEKDVLTAVIEARAKATQIKIDASQLTDPEKLKRFQDAQNQLTGALGRLLAVSENYPDLKSNANFLALQSQLEGTENRIAVARRDYIDAVRAYNTSLRTFPTLLWAKTFFSGNKPMAEFAASEGCGEAAAGEILNSVRL